ncbi:MAG: TIGR00266 family protein, partial [Actinomycetota bacterium]|nr:TIGR00266 family protein [Actinomycetota bacterium]
MRVELRHNPSFTVARCFLQPKELLRVEGGAMIAHSVGVVLEAKAQGGVMAGLKRSVLGGGSFFVTTYTAPQQGGWVDVAGMLPGDLVSIEVAPDRPFFLRKGSWIANSAAVQVDTQWGGMANLFGGEGGFGFRASGQGEALVSIYGAVDIIDLEEGEQVTIDTGHVVAYDLSIRFSMRRAVQGRSIQSMKSGEGFVFDFFGPGRVLLQTRNPEA